jgi:glycosyltransferase involved in cell wall biosynthesis
MSQSRDSISVFFPVFNDGRSISQLVLTALEVLPLLTNDYEVLVINDGSTDETPVVLDELARACAQVKVIHHSHNKGYGAALRSGFTKASKDLIFYTDGDGQYDVRDLLKLYPLLSEGVDVVNGFKLKRADRTHRKVFGGIYKSLARFLFQLPIRDVDCDFRLLRQSALQQIDLVTSSGGICVELVRKLHARGSIFVETPVNHYPRAHGRSQFFTLRGVGRTALDFSGLWWRLVLLPYFSSDLRAGKHTAHSGFSGVTGNDGSFPVIEDSTVNHP